MRWLLLWVALVACDSGERPAKSAPVRDASVDANFAKLSGRDTYQALCAPCHGVDAKGYAADHAPSLVNPTFLESANDGFLSQSIQHGRPGTSMAAYGKAMHGPLDDESVMRVVAYLRSLGPVSLALPAMTLGDPARGAPLYDRNCKVCHGEGKVRGEAMLLSDPQFLAVATPPFLRYAIERGRPGTKMVAWGQMLTTGEIDDLVGYLRSLGGGAKTVELPQLPPPTGTEPLVLNPEGKDPSFTLRAEPCPKPAGACKEDPRFVSADQVHAALLAKKKLIIVDARPASEWMRVHVTGAVSIPHFELKRLDEVPADAWVITYCACPHHLSGIVLDELRKRGHKRAAVLDEGITEWHRRGYPVVAAEGVERPPPLPPQPKN